MEGRTRARALSACGKVILPLTRILIALGISAPEFTNHCKRLYVLAAADRLTTSAKRLNRSRIAIVTGLTRAEVTRLLRSGAAAEMTHQSHLHRARRVLDGWRADPEFASRKGRPLELPLKGRQGSFEALVKRYSGDIPPRAMLDELCAMSAVCKQKNGHIRVNSHRRVSAISSKEIVSLGNQGRSLIDTLCHNLEDRSRPLFAGTVIGRAIDAKVVDLLLQRIQSQGQEFLARIDDQFKHPPGPRKGRVPKVAGRQTLGVTVFAHRGLDR